MPPPETTFNPAKDCISSAVECMAPMKRWMTLRKLHDENGQVHASYKVRDHPVEIACRCGRDGWDVVLLKYYYVKLGAGAQPITAVPVREARASIYDIVLATDLVHPISRRALPGVLRCSSEIA